MAINIIEFEKFIISQSLGNKITIENFKDNLHFIDIDCYPNQPYILTIEISNEDIKFSTIRREAEIDFSLYDYAFTEINEAKSFFSKITKETAFPIM
ncbi:hypothetical protein KHS38_20220 [Mucilaginibacter sp. Bleaf8]|uniref:hypothetical protein n=1 Tax=Mucilaginibacter sp. Bleaf8 TaxID=2834430 RepID=UPI001BCF0026|nr:hypothetical protein [Mucilaginibacter sp. Bleaf8]MBS7566742.1 hypothetical protein [Mucilaginibacter sp. Bleaf8]